MKQHLWRILIALLVIAGLGLILYPIVSDQMHRSKAAVLIVEYTDEVQKKNEAERKQMLQDAMDYNTRLADGSVLPDEEGNVPGYDSILDVTGTGIMGYLDIERIGVQLPIYHGTDNGVLQIGVGHINYSSLPVGGESAHCVLSGHRGLPSAKLFTDLPELAIGDEFTITVMGRVMTYRVDQIKTVLPTELDDLQIVEGKDYCTLVTCTPYGVNSHRLLVRGERVLDGEVDRPRVMVTNEAIQVEPFIVATFLAVPLLLGVIIFVSLHGREKKPRKKEGEVHEKSETLQ
ncbi:MAG: class C sortase [Clostridiales bacterium]|nr:class C sortase [Candidatus Scatonaster coprocaballi]